MPEDLLGVGRGAEKLLEIIARGVGVLYKPTATRRQADAEAYALKTLERAKTEAAIESDRLRRQSTPALPTLDATEVSLEDRAEARRLKRELTAQENVESVIEHAFRNIPADVSPDPVDPDWLSTLFRFAEDAHSERMQELWGKILAGETAAPGSYSRKALDTLRGMTQFEATAFQQACAVACTLGDNPGKFIVLSTNRRSGLLSFIGVSSLEINLQYHGLSYDSILNLRSIGLLQPENLEKPFNRARTSSRDRRKTLLRCNGINLSLRLKSRRAAWIVHSFTPIGNELSRLIPDAPNSSYVSALKQMLRLTHELADEDSQS
jgi:uncharacterized repeat protein (TIGR03899 family)